ncbi:uncharacterized protein [Eleutherodactylus coqui]|uniref:uncharacterized protein isoform X1 n=1 Tax=Eleutherodactylus coqui TaxID=57060 RepID=UPI003462A095
MGGRRVSALLLGLLSLISGGAQEETSPVATSSPLLVSSADFPDSSVSSGASGPPDATSEAPGNEKVTEPLAPSLSPSVGMLQSDGAGGNVTADLEDATAASNETTHDPSKTLPPTDGNETASANATPPPLPTQPPPAANSMTADAATETPSLLATLRTTAAGRTLPSNDSTPYATTSMSLHSTLISAVTTSLFITTTVTSPEPNSTATPYTTRAEVQRGSAVLKVEDDKGPADYHSRSSSNPLFVMIVSIFTIMVVMVVVVVGFHRYKKRNSRTEFRRLQDLPMDDMMEDTPLSLYSY